MKIINNGLPKSVYECLLADFYDRDAAKDTLSATTLLKPVQEVILTKRHWDAIEVDATDRIWSLFGSAVHAVLEKVDGGPQDEREERLYVDVFGAKVSGKFDRVSGDVLHDYKVTSAYTIVYGSRAKEWREQLSIYRYLYHTNKGRLLADKAIIIAILRDWTARDAARGGNYPQMPIVEIPIELMSIDGTREFIESRVSGIQVADGLPDRLLPKCSDEERWWNEKKKTYMKCDKYCMARAFCAQAHEDQITVTEERE